MTQAIDTDESRQTKITPFFLWRHLNKLRWLTLSTVFLIILLLPMLGIYQSYVAAHAYDLLYPQQKFLYDSMEWLTQLVTSDPETALDQVKGTTWSSTIFGYTFSDPLAVVSQIFASQKLNMTFVLSALIPVILSVIFGRFFCGWICPASLIYELNSNLSVWLEKWGLKPFLKSNNPALNKKFKYFSLAVVLVTSLILGSVLAAAIYPPAIIGREIYYAIALGGFSSGALFFLITILFDLLITRRAFCNYLCPGGALYSLLGRYRPLRIKRIVENCNDCEKCNAVCEFKLTPQQDEFGQECNNCTACIAACPTDAMTFVISIQDSPYQGPGHLGKAYKKASQATAEN